MNINDCIVDKKQSTLHHVDDEKLLDNILDTYPYYNSEEKKAIREVVSKVSTLSEWYDPKVISPIKYRQTKNNPNTKTNPTMVGLHHGQRKLFIGELQFLTIMLENSDSKAIIVYAGSAPGHHHKYLRSLFPNTEWHLYDPATFHIKSDERTILYNEPFTNDIALSWKDRADLFISDIRRGSNEDTVAFEKQVYEDMAEQLEWTKAIEPRIGAMLKFRPPYITENTKLIKKYPPGKILFQVWNSRVSTETRLIMTHDEIKADYIDFDVENYQNSLSYLNIIIRPWANYNIPEKGLKEVKGYDNCHNCVLEAMAWMRYKIKSGSTITIKQYMNTLGKVNKQFLNASKKSNHGKWGIISRIKIHCNTVLGGNEVLVSNNTNFPTQVTVKLKNLYTQYNIARMENSNGWESTLKYYQYLVRAVVCDPEYGIGNEGNARGLLVYHTMGMGKTRLAVAIAMAMWDKRPIIVMLAKSLQDNFLDTVKSVIDMIFTDPVDRINQNKIALMKITFVSMDAYNSADQLSRVGTGVNRKKSKVLGGIDGKLLIVDEAHNLFRAIINSSSNTANARRIYDTIMSARNLRLLFLTGTPSAKDPFELVPCFNMLAGKDLLPTQYENFYKLYVDKKTHSVLNKNKLANRLIGLVSHVSPHKQSEPISTNVIFEGDVYDAIKLWSLKADIVEVSTDLFVSILSDKIWTDRSGNYSPQDVIDNKDRWKDEYLRISSVDVKYPIMVLKPDNIIIDGIRRLARLLLIERISTVNVKYISKDELLETKTFAAKKAQDDGWFPKELPTIVEKIEMGSEQYRYYNLAREKENLEGKSIDGFKAPVSSNTAALSLPGSDKKSAKTYFVKSRNFSTFCPPGEWQGSPVDSMPDELFTPDIAPKLALISARVDIAPGPVLIYSQFVNTNGLKPLGRYLQKLGYSIYNTKIGGAVKKKQSKRNTIAVKKKPTEKKSSKKKTTKKKPPKSKVVAKKPTSKKPKTKKSTTKKDTAKKTTTKKPLNYKSSSDSDSDSSDKSEESESEEFKFDESKSDSSGESDESDESKSDKSDESKSEDSKYNSGEDSYGQSEDELNNEKSNEDSYSDSEPTSHKTYSTMRTGSISYTPPTDDTVKKLTEKLAWELSAFDLSNKLVKVATISNSSSKVKRETRNCIERWIITGATGANFKEHMPWNLHRGLLNNTQAQIKLSQELDSIGASGKIVSTLYRILVETIGGSVYVPREIKVDIVDSKLVIKMAAREEYFGVHMGQITALMKRIKTNSKLYLAIVVLRYAAALDGGQQLGLPRSYFEKLYEAGFRNEGYASPLNSRFILLNKPDTNFCSLFPDTDGPFGSLGSFNDCALDTIPGYWFINPPFVESIMINAANKGLDIINSAVSRNLSMRMTFMFPAWDDSIAIRSLVDSSNKHITEKLLPGNYSLETPGGRITTSPFGIYYITFEINIHPIPKKLLASMASARKSQKIGGGPSEHKGQYAIISGDVTTEERLRIKEIFNSEANSHGEIIKAILVSKTGAEGLDLKWIRETHQIEPYWDKSRDLQVIGRAVRIGAHDGLPIEERIVQPYLYISIPNKKIYDAIPDRNKELKTIDESFFERANEKYLTNIAFQQLLVEVCLECGIFGYGSCRICAPSNSILYHNDAEVDIRLRDPCSVNNESKVAALSVILNEVIYYYKLDPTEPSGYTFYKYSSELDGYASVDTSDPIIFTLIDMINAN